ncbi:hypothetical protein Ciccas_010231 [Cichlidogyrus casuarinus]|uniref:Cyclic nucleotide-binding domain-containing protein n=1 Tax=Cichlidogyrus casuarinus TaxID=1844966 RepID=A0ABD2PUQ5_9PLAT
MAKTVAYERYDDNRILARQGSKPEKLYYIISGKIIELRTYQLSSGTEKVLIRVLEKDQITEVPFVMANDNALGRGNDASE